MPVCGLQKGIPACFFLKWLFGKYLILAITATERQEEKCKLCFPAEELEINIHTPLQLCFSCFYFI